MAKDMAKDIGIGLIGTGFGLKVHLPAFNVHHRTQVTALYHRDATKAQALAAANGIAFATADLTALLQHPQVQAVSISTPPFLHFEQAKAAIAAGKHVFLEKPTTLSATEAKTLHQMAQAQGVAVALDFEFRFIPAWQRLKELLDEGYIGNLRYVKVDWLGSSRADANRAWNWYAQKSQGGGTLGSIGSHAFDYLDWLFGPAQRLSARLSTVIPQRPDPSENNTLKSVTSDDVCNVTLSLSNDVPIQVCLSAVTMQGRGHFVEVYGDRGTLILGNANQKDYIHGFVLQGSQGGADLAELPIPDRLAFAQTFEDGRIAPIVRVIDTWVNAIDSGQPIAPSLEEGVYAQLVMDACWRSHEQASWVDIPACFG